jgi:neutral ceramidase
MMRVGTGKASLTFQDNLPLFGFGPQAGWGLNVPHGSAEADTLQVRALYLEDAASKLLVVSFDLGSGSRVLQQSLLQALAQRGHRLSDGQLWVVGTHTHAAPGGYLGNGYDLLGAFPTRKGTSVLAELVRQGLAAALAAIALAVDATLSVDQSVLWGWGRNRSLSGMLAKVGGDLGAWHRELGVTPPAALTPEEAAIDPRLTVVTFRALASGATLAVWATWCCHPATLPRALLRPYHRDWPGVAVDRLEQQVPFAMLHQAANGDVTALPPGERRNAEPLQRLQSFGQAIGDACLAVSNAASGHATSFELGFYDFVPAQEGLPKFEFGAPAMAGSEEFDPGWLVRLFGEARRFPWRFNAQKPKFPALGPLQYLVRDLPALQPSPSHPLWLLKLGEHLLFASPFEQTSCAARDLEKAIVERWYQLRGERVSASAIGLVGDYAGYLTSPEEFGCQNYEGAHTLYGSGQLEALRRGWLSMIGRDPLDHSASAISQDAARMAAAVDRVLAAL